MFCKCHSSLVTGHSSRRNRNRRFIPDKGPVTRDKGRGGFSLVEIMVVLVIIGLLAGVVTLNVRHFMIKGKQNTARMEISNICQAVESFYATFGRYPSNEEGLAVLTQTNDKLPEKLLNQMPSDPWGKSYQYNQPGRSEPYEVICFGADGREGGEGADRDIVSWDLKDRQAEAGR